MSKAYPTPLVSTEWLAAHLDDPDVVVLDCSYHLPTAARDAKTEFLTRRLAGARFFDFDGAIKDPDGAAPHMLPEAGVFEREVGKLGISNDSYVVSYDVYGLSSAARGWWMFRAFGHDQVSVLDGGLPKWEREQRPIETTPPGAVEGARFEAVLRPELIVSAEALLALLGRVAILDARSAERFHGTAPEPRAGLRSGHIPTSASMPFQQILTAEGTVRPVEELRALFEAAGIDINGPTVCTCGSGVTACNLALALKLAGGREAAVYDGSWSEWGASETLPVEI